jgi:hypothetical protein
MEVIMKFRLLTFVFAIGLFIAACSPVAVKQPAPAPVEKANTTSVGSTPASDASQTGEVSFSKDIWPVIEKYALAAHGGKGGVFLENYKDIMRYVVPGKPEESQLYQELTGNGMPQMPRGNPLPSATIQLFYDWIKQGAKNN